MSRPPDMIARWVDERLAEMLAAPPMWGSPEAVEMQVLQLLQVRALAVRPEQEIANPRRVFETYLAYLRERFPRRPQQPLFELVGHDDPLYSSLSTELRGFMDALVPTMLEENPFQHSAVAIKLVFERGKAPATSAFTSYYEEFRKTARAVARRPGTEKGRAEKPVEDATDFSLQDVRVQQPNGKPAEVALLLGYGNAVREPLSSDPNDVVRQALSNLLAMGEWASSGATLAELPMDDGEQRTRLAVQARRLLPSRGIESVSIGGQLVARSKPVVFRAAHERRFLDVIGSSTTPQPFDLRDEIRAVDLDRGLLVLGKTSRLPCHVRPGTLSHVFAAGVLAHVVGQIYRPLGGRPFVLVETLEILESPQDD